MSDYLKPCALPSSIFRYSPDLVIPLQTLEESSPTPPSSPLIHHSPPPSSPNRDTMGSPPEKLLTQIQDSVGLLSSPPLKSLVGPYSDFMKQKDSIDSTENSCSSSKTTPTGVGAGLCNLGNTCFVNSVLQCITHSVPLMVKILCSDNCEFDLMKVLKEHIEQAVKYSGHFIAPYWFQHNLNYFSSEFVQNQQEDAHEFLQSFLDKLDSCNVYPTDQGANIVEQVFGGRLVSRLRCCNCNSFSDTLESSLGWSLEIEDVDDLWSALESFTCVEELEDKLTCDNCNNKVFKKKQLVLHELPVIASFHLKRFKNDGFNMEKIFKHIKFPLELDLRPYMSDSSRYPNGSTKYHLYAFVEHLGSTVTSGHYTSYVRSAHEVWHNFDDAVVTRVSEESVLSQDPYILFYAREGTEWFSATYEKIKPLIKASPMMRHSPNSVLDRNENYANSNNASSNSEAVASPSAFQYHEVQEEMFHSAESNSDDSSMGDALEFTVADKPMPEISPKQEQPEISPQQEQPEISPQQEQPEIQPEMYRKAANPPKIRNQNWCRKRKEGSFRIQREHLQSKKNLELISVNPSKSVNSAADKKDAKIALSYLNRQPSSSRAKSLAAAMAASPSSPSKKRKQFKLPTANPHRYVRYGS